MKSASKLRVKPASLKLFERYLEIKKMNRMRGVYAIYLTLAAIFFGGLGALDANAQTGVRSELETRSIVRSLNSKIDDFRYSLDYGLRNGSASGTRDDEEIENYLRALDGKIRDFEENVNQRRENRDDVSDILYAARGINDFLARNRVNSTVERDWNEIRALLDRLAVNYGVSSSWRSGAGASNTRNYPTRNSSSNNSVSFGLTGTYNLDESRSENARDIIASTGVRNEEQRIDLENKLETVAQIAIEVRGSQVTLASSKAAPISFVADGRTRTENTGSRTIRVRALLRGQELTISSVGGETDYTVTFASLDNGRSLKVTRRITTAYLRQTIFSDSFYNKTDAVARLDINENSPDTASNVGNNRDDSSDGGNGDDDGGDGQYSSNDPADDGNNDPNAPVIAQSRTGNFVVPNGTIVTGVLENDLTTGITQNNDRFRLTVQSPDQFRGATIEGYVSGVSRSGKATGSSKITFNFERITLRNGRTYEFAGYLQSVTDQNGKTVKIDSEGTAKGDSQTKETVKRGGIGAGLGALIGAIAGGGKGAAIGAIIGGSAGAGSVVLQGKEDLDLRKGSMMTVQATAPNR